MKTIEERLTALETEVARLSSDAPGIETRPHSRIGKTSPVVERMGAGVPPIDMIFGTFANDPDYEAAMRKGREYREAQRPLRAHETPGGTVDAA